MLRIKKSKLILLGIAIIFLVVGFALCINTEKVYAAKTEPINVTLYQDNYDETFSNDAVMEGNCYSKTSDDGHIFLQSYNLGWLWTDQTDRIKGSVKNISASLSGTLDNITFNFNVTKGVVDEGTNDFKIWNHNDWGYGYIKYDFYKGTTLVKSDAVKDAIDMSLETVNPYSIKLGALEFTNYTIKISFCFRIDNGKESWVDYKGNWTYNFSFTQKTASSDYSVSITSSTSTAKQEQDGILYFNDGFSCTWTDGTGAVASKVNNNTTKIAVKSLLVASIDNTTYEKGTQKSLTQGKHTFVIKTVYGSTVYSKTIIVDNTKPTITLSEGNNKNIYRTGTKIYYRYETSSSTGVVSFPQEAPIKSAVYTRQLINETDNGFTLGATVTDKREFSSGLVLWESGYYTVTITDLVGNSSTKSFYVKKGITQNNYQKLINSGYFKSDNYKVQISNTTPVQIVQNNSRFPEYTAKYPGKYSQGNTYVFANEQNAKTFMSEIILNSEVTVVDGGGFKYKQKYNLNGTTTYPTFASLMDAISYHASRNVAKYGEVLLNSTIYSDYIVLDNEAISNKTKQNKLFIGSSFEFKNISKTINSVTYNTAEKIRITKENNLFKSYTKDGIAGLIDNYVGTIPTVVGDNVELTTGNSSSCYYVFKFSGLTKNAKYYVQFEASTTRPDFTNEVLGMSTNSIQSATSLNTYIKDGALKTYSIDFTASSNGEYYLVFRLKNNYPSSGGSIAVKTINIYSSIYYGTPKNFKECIGNTNAGDFNVTQIDNLGQSHQFSVFYDNVAPTMTVNYEKFTGQGAVNDKGVFENKISTTTNQTITATTNIDTNFKSLSLKQVVDSYDNIVTAKIETPTGDVIVTRDFSTLTFGEDKTYTAGGEYSIKIYDRSLNYFEFKFVIVGRPPQLSESYDGVGDDKMLNLVMSNGSAISSITEFTIYRYGQALPKEDVYYEYIDGKVVNYQKISQSVFAYSFYLGGQYQVVFKDNFNRITYSQIVTFKKGLPTYTLTGVTEGGKTNKPVSITFNSKIGYELKRNGTNVTGYCATVTNGYKIEIPAVLNDAENNGLWELLLYIKADENTKISFSFTIDTLAPIVQAYKQDGTAVAWNTCVNEPIFVDWGIAENVVKSRYSIDGYVSIAYTQKSILTENGMYEFIITDDVGNVSNYAIELDTEVDFDISYNGNHYENDGKVFVKSGFTFSEVEANLNVSILKDDETTILPTRLPFTYTAPGKYEITVSDYMQNTAVINIVIDQSAPTVTLQQENEYSNVNVSMDIDDIYTCKYQFRGKTISLELSDTMMFSDWGKYSLTVSDRLGNAETYEFEILKVPPKIQAYNFDGTLIEDGTTVNKGFYVTWDDELASARVSMGGAYGKEYKPFTLLTEEGTYSITVTDEAKNKSSISINIVKAIKYSLLTEKGTTLETMNINGIEKTTDSFYIAIIDELTITAKKDGEAFSLVANQLVTVDGSYYIHISDSFGNFEERTIVIDTTAPELTFSQGVNNTDSVKVTLDISDVWSVVVTHKDVATSNTMFNIEQEYSFTEWGYYTITASDKLGNASTITFAIEKLPPRITFKTLSGRILKNNDISNEGVFIEFDEDLVIKYGIGDSFKIIYKQDTILSEQGTYNISVTDVADNVYNYTLYLDSEIAFNVVIDGKTVKDFNEEVVGKRYIEFTFNESLNAVYTLNAGTEKVISEMVKRFTDEGKYQFTFTDVAGNSMLLKFELDHTAPLVSIDTDNYTKNDVVFSVDDLNDIYKYSVKKDGSNVLKFTLQKSNVFTEEGTYSITVQDALGNRNVTDFTIKRAIKYSLSVANGFVTDGTVKLELKENNLIISAKHNGENLVLEQGEEFIFTAPGKYEITLTDEIGNEKILTFSLDATKYKKSFVFDIPLDSEITVKKDGQELDLDAYISGDKLSLTEDGEYAITFKNGNVRSYYNFVIDSEMPVLLLNGERVENGTDLGTINYDFKVSSSKKNATIEIYFNDEKIDWSASETFSAQGHYKIVITDKVGNVVTYEFDRAFTFNTGAILLFCVIGLVIVLVVVLIIRRRIKMRIM